MRDLVLGLCWGVMLVGAFILLALGFCWVVDRLLGREQSEDTRE